MLQLPQQINMDCFIVFLRFIMTLLAKGVRLFTAIKKLDMLHKTCSLPWWQLYAQRPCQNKNLQSCMFCSLNNGNSNNLKLKKVEGFPTVLCFSSYKLSPPFIVCH